ncbi:MAG: thiamine phosphate synthase, partial [Lysobacteraceae bacterium]
VNGDIVLAQALGIGVHLRAGQLMTLSARPLPQAARVIASCHSYEDLAAAQALRCDAAVLGSILSTPSHPGDPGIGWERFVEMRERVAIPIYAIGGMSRAHVERARSHGAQGIAAIRDLWPVSL